MMATTPSEGAAAQLEPRSASVPFSFRAFRTGLVVLCSVAVLFLLISALRFIPAVGDNSYPEAAAILSASRFAQGLGLYTDYHQAPYIVTAFPPFWYVLLAVPAWLGVKDLDTLTVLGRLLALGALFGVAALAYLWNRRIGRPGRLAVLSPAFYLSLPILIPWAFTARPDFPSLLCSMLALYLIGQKASGRAVMASALVAAVAFLIRHNAVPVPVSVVLWLLWSRRWRHAVLFCAVWGAAVGSTVALFQAWSGGLLLLNLSGAKFGRMALTYGRDTILRLMTSPGHGMATALLSFGLFGFFCNRKERDARSLLTGIYLPVSVLFAGLGSLAAGADINHWFEPSLALALLIPAGLARMEAGWSKDAVASRFLAVLLLVLVVPSLDVARWGVMHTRPADMRRLLPYAGNKNVFTDVPYLAARARQPVVLDMASLAYAIRSGQWSPAPLIGALDQKEYELVILGEGGLAAYDPAALYPRYPHLDPTLQAAVRRNYKFCFDLDAVDVYAPNGAKCP
jgi:hypothetical protein